MQIRDPSIAANLINDISVQYKMIIAGRAQQKHKPCLDILSCDMLRGKSTQGPMG